jgi:hypothetical protein
MIMHFDFRKLLHEPDGPNLAKLTDEFRLGITKNWTPNKVHLVAWMTPREPECQLQNKRAPWTRSTKTLKRPCLFLLLLHIKQKQYTSVLTEQVIVGTSMVLISAGKSDVPTEGFHGFLPSLRVNSGTTLIIRELISKCFHIYHLHIV